MDDPKVVQAFLGALEGDTEQIAFLFDQIQARIVSLQTTLKTGPDDPGPLSSLALLILAHQLVMVNVPSSVGRTMWEFLEKLAGAYITAMEIATAHQTLADADCPEYDLTTPHASIRLTPN